MIKQSEKAEKQIPHQVMQLNAAVSEYGMEMFLKLLSEKIIYKDCEKKLQPGAKFKIVASRCITSFLKSSYASPVNEDSFVLKTRETCSLWKVVASQSFYGANRKQFDIGMIENDKDLWQLFLRMICQSSLLYKTLRNG